MKEPEVNVAIMNSNDVEFVFYGDFKSTEFTDEFNGKMRASYVDGKIIIRTSQKEYKPLDEILFKPVDPVSESFLLKNVTIGLEFHWEQKQDQRFSGSLKLIIENEKITVVNIVSVEEYLTSVISSEMSATSSPELLKAHAIISRGWLLAQMNSRNSENRKMKGNGELKSEKEIIRWYDREDHILYDVCADDHCQRYQGITRNHAHNAESAVAETRGLILFYEDQICDTRFSKSCGGITELFENVWEDVNHPYLESFTDYKFDPDGYNTNLINEEDAVKWISESPPAFCNTTDEKILDQVLNQYDRKTKDFYRWAIEYSQNDLSNLINEKTGEDFGNIIDLVPIERGPSGRLIKLKIIGDKKTLIIGKELEIRKVLSKSHLYSSAIFVNKLNLQNGVPQKFIIYGAGWGHGVGLCQIGAAVMGEKGYKFDEILLHYYRGANIRKIYD